MKKTVPEGTASLTGRNDQALGDMSAHDRAIRLAWKCYTLSPSEAEFDVLTLWRGTIQLRV